MARVWEEFPLECLGSRSRIGSTSAPRSERRIQPGQSRRLLLMIRPARLTPAEVPLADLSLNTPIQCYLSVTVMGASHWPRSHKM